MKRCVKHSVELLFASFFIVFEKNNDIGFCMDNIIWTAAIC